MVLEVQLFPLVPRVALPAPAPARTRAQVEAGYGVQEQCLPFTAASALGFLIPSPIDFGLCLPHDVPAGAHGFRSPLDRPRPDGSHDDKRLFYVKDNPDCRFGGNAYALELALPGERGVRYEPGISFFDRADQLDLFKLHLPYVWRTAAGVDTLFLPPLNRACGGLTLLSGLVETEWYANPVNLVLRKPPGDARVHVAAGDPLAQAVFISRESRRPTLNSVPPHARAARTFLAALAEWYRARSQDRSAYKRLARSHHGRVDPAGDAGSEAGRKI